MIYRKLFITASFMCVCAAGWAAQGSAGSATVSFYSEAAMVGLKTSAMKAKQAGKVDDKTLECVKKLNSDELKPVIQSVLKRELSPDEIKAADTFYSSPTGQKVKKYSILQAYIELGEAAAEPLPTFSDADNQVMDKFDQTSASKKLNEEKVMTKPGERETIDAKMNEMAKRCMKS